MSINKYLIAFAFTLSSLLSFAQQETHEENKIVGNQLQSQTQSQDSLYSIDPKFTDIKNQTVFTSFTSVNPNVSIHFGFIDDRINTAEYQKIYSCRIIIAVTPYDNADHKLTSTIDTLTIKHDNVTKGIKFKDYAVFKVPGVHKAGVKIKSITYFNDAGPISVDNSSAYLQLKFSTDRYYNLQLSSTQSSSVLPLEHKFIKYTGTAGDQVNNVTDGAEEILISWHSDPAAPAVEYELEWTWIDNFAANGGTLSANEIPLSDQDFKLNSTRIQTKDTVYRIPIVYSKGYIVYRVRPVGRFLDNISKNYYGNWTSGFAESHQYIIDWSNYLVIDQNHEDGKKNWQYQSSFAEDGKKKEVVSYFDGSLRNRQTVTKINSNNKAVVGEVIYDNQGRAAVEILPVPVGSSGIHFYPDLNKNSLGTSIYTHNDFDWDKENEKECAPTLIDSMSNTSGASKYYSGNNDPQDNYQDLVPDANLRPFSQIEYTPDNTGRIKRKGGVGKDHQIGTGHEMQYFYSSPDQKQLNRLFGYKVGNAIHYKKNMVIDPNGQISVSYLDPQGRTIATALAGDKKGNLLSLEEEAFAPLHLRTSTSLIDKNYKYASGNNSIIQDGIRLNSAVEIVKKDSITFNYNFDKTIGSYNDSCLTNKYYPFVYDWSISMTDDCANELLIGLNGAKLIDQIGTVNLSSYAPTQLNAVKIFEGKTRKKDNSLDFLEIGKYSLTKNLQVNTDALNQYADDYIKQLKLGTACKPILTEFEVPVLETDCNVTCRSCEEALVTSYLTDTSKIAEYKATFPTDESSLGDTSIREPFLLLAKAQYVIANLPAIELTPEELINYTKHYEAEFTSLITNCRELCQQPVNLCNINEQTLLADVSPNGQYGSIEGLEREAPQDENGTPVIQPETNGDLLSVFSDNNQLLYGGYKNTTGPDPNNPNIDISIKVAKNNWRYPVGGYKNENDEPSLISVVKNEDGTYSPPLRYLDSNEPDPTSKDPANDDENFRLVAPEYLANAADFLAIWQSSWAKALLPFHPEYQYYAYNLAVCQKTNTDGDNSDGFDEKLRNQEYLNPENGDKDNTIFSQNGIIAKLIKETVATDPFYTQLGTDIETDTEYNFRKSIISEGLGDFSSISGNFDGMTFKNAQGFDVKMNMLQTAYFFAAYSNGITPVTDYQGVLIKSNSNLLYDINGLADPYLKQRIWSNFKSYYIALKEKTRTVFTHIYANKKQMNNSCIGDTKNTDSYVTLLKKYTANYTAITTLIDDSLSPPAIPSGFDGIVPICMDEAAAYYADKVKRFVPADYSYDSGLSDQEAMASAQAKANANLFLETGKCPLGLDMENFLKGLTDATIQPNGLLVNTPASSMPYLTFGIFNAQVNPGFILNGAPESPKIYGYAIGTDLAIDFTVQGNSIATPILLKFAGLTASYKNPCGGTENLPTWADVAGFKNFHYISYDPNTKTYKFSILATIVRKGITPTCITPEEVIIEGYTKAAVGECHFTGGNGIGETIAFEDTQCNKKETFSTSLKNLMMHLQENNTLSTDQDITNDSVFKNGFLPTYLGVQPGDIIKWDYEIIIPYDRHIYITVNNIKKIDLNTLDSRIPIGEITDLFITSGTNNLILKAFETTFSGKIPRIRRYAIKTGKGKELYFACCAPCGEWDYDGDGYGDKCGNPDGIAACNLNATEEITYEENLKNALNEVINHHVDFPTPQATSSNVAISNFVSESNLIAHFQALRNYRLDTSPGGYVSPVQLSRYDVLYSTGNIGIQFGNDLNLDAQIQFFIPNADKIKNIISIDIQNNILCTAKVKYIDINNQTITADATILNEIATSYLHTDLPQSFCQFMSNDYSIPPEPLVIACDDSYDQYESNYEINFKNALNEAIANGPYSNYINPFSDAKATKLKHFINENSLINHFQSAKNYYFSLNSYSGALTNPVSLSQVYISFSSSSSIQFIFNNDGYLVLNTVNADHIREILHLDIQDENGHATIIYKDVDNQIVIDNNAIVDNSVMLAVQNNTLIGGRPTFCQLISNVYPTPIQNRFLKNNKTNNDIFQVTADENGFFIKKNQDAKLDLRLVSLQSTALKIGLPTCSALCVPPTVAPVVCGDKWNAFKTGLQIQMPTYELPKDLKDNGTFFCEANYGYISSDYLAYLIKFNIITAQDPLFLTIAEFGSTKLKYGNDQTPNVINAYYTYIQSQIANPQGETQNWNDFANSYVTSHNICAPATIVPSFSLGSSAKPGDKTPCEIYKKAINKTNSQQVSDAFYADKKEAFKQNYLKAALEGLTEELTQNTSDKEYQYTLYYYDQAGNLVQTVPPEGVNRLAPTSDTTIDNIRKTNSEKEDTAGVNGIPVSPPNTLQTQYRYNSLNQLVWQQTPDGGETVFAYDKLGRIIASQNAKQKLQSQFSYTRYDALGRITEAGQLQTKTGLALTINKNGRLVDSAGDDVDVDAVKKTVNYPYNITDATEQVTKTIYDNPLPDTQSWFTDYGSDNSHKRVTAVLYFDTLTSSSPVASYANGIFYDYDVHGNVKELVHHSNNGDLSRLNSTTKKVVYDYDLISGNVNKVTYQPDSAKDQFIHRYEYDADNRIQQVYTSKDNIIWEKEANYLYYDHGPLARVEIGDKQVQGLDYIYTLQGWLKGVNSERIGAEFDAGKDGLSVAQDAFGFALNYYKGDYKSRSNTRDSNIFSYSIGLNMAKENRSLYNGNIKEMVTSLSNNDEAKPLATQYNFYQYDQLNRIREMTSQAILGTTASNSYASNYSYDRNGNLKSLFASAPLNGVITDMDRLTYNYNSGTNQLRRVNDLVGNGVFTNSSTNPNDTSLDIDNQYDKDNPGNPNYENYTYDKIGQLTQDKQEGINIEWRVDGKVKSVTKNNGTVISFEYDGLGNRIAKVVTTPTKTTTTFYERDAQGNVLSTYEMNKTGNQITYDLIEQDIYGSSRLGVEKGRKSISAATATAALRKSVVSSKLLASVEPMAITANVSADPLPQYGLSFDTTTDGTVWEDKKPENAINFFNTSLPLTKSITLATHLKINPANLDGVHLIAALHNVSKKGNNWPDSDTETLLNSVLLSVKKTDKGYLPMVSLLNYKRINHKYKNHGTKISFRNYRNRTNYRVTSTPIPEDEWDLKAIISKNSADKYSVEITVNGNVYTTKATDTIEANGEINIEGKRTDAPELNINLPANSLGGAYVKYYDGKSGDAKESTTYNALLSEMCDFTYSVKNDQLPEDIEVNEYTFDEQTENENAKSITGPPMTLKGIVRIASFCGTKEGDRDGDGKIDKIDNCPNIFNPGQEDDDHDGVGNVCDNCIYPNPLQIDKDNDGRGDGDNPGDLGCDNCKQMPNFDQIDSDGDGVGDVCDNCRFKENPLQEDVNSNGVGDVCEGLAQGEGKNAIPGEPIAAYRFIGDKQYELSNHLGNVLSVISDRSLIKLTSTSTQETLNSYDFTGWTSVNDDSNWTKFSTVKSVIADGSKLLITANDSGQGVALFMFTPDAGKKYTVSYDVELLNSSGINVKISNGGTTLQQKTETASGRQTISFIATGVISSIQWTRVKSNDGNDEAFTLDNVVTSVESTENPVVSTTFVPDVLSYSDYYPFGQLVPNRHGSSDSYRYGFNGKEKDDELKGEGLQYDYGFRIYDPRISKFLSTDPLQDVYPELTPYQFASNSPIQGVDLDGREIYHYTLFFPTDGRKPLLTYLGEQTNYPSGIWPLDNIDRGKSEGFKNYDGDKIKSKSIEVHVIARENNGIAYKPDKAKITFSYFSELKDWVNNDYKGSEDERAFANSYQKNTELNTAITQIQEGMPSSNDIVVPKVKRQQSSQSGRQLSEHEMQGIVGGNGSIRPEKIYFGSKKHGIKWNEGSNLAKDSGIPQGQWGKNDLEFATQKASTLKSGESSYFELPAGADSKVHMPDGTTQSATYIWIRNNGTGTFHGHPRLDNGTTN